MRILITGADGQVGRELAEWCSNAGVDTVRVGRSVDVRDRAAMADAVVSARPDVVVHAAAWTAVDACESDPEHAHAVNADGTGFVVEAARRAQARVVYVSTDYVFDGTKPSPYVESDLPSPVSVYGKSKFAGEEHLDLALDTIVRISWVCGRYGNNMVKTLVRLADEGAEPLFVTDQRGHPTIVSDLVPMLHRLADEGRCGIYHVTNQGAVSWFEFARETFAAAGHDPDRVRPITTEQLTPARPAPRPANSVLDNAALRRDAIALLPDFRESLPELVGQVRA